MTFTVAIKGTRTSHVGLRRGGTPTKSPQDTSGEHPQSDPYEISHNVEGLAGPPCDEPVLHELAHRRVEDEQREDDVQWQPGQDGEERGSCEQHRVDDLVSVRNAHVG